MLSLAKRKKAELKGQRIDHKDESIEQAQLADQAAVADEFGRSLSDQLEEFAHRCAAAEQVRHGPPPFLLEPQGGCRDGQGDAQKRRDEAENQRAELAA